MTASIAFRCDACGDALPGDYVEPADRRGQKRIVFHFYSYMDINMPAARYDHIGGEMRTLHACPNLTCLGVVLEKARNLMESDVRRDIVPAIQSAALSCESQPPTEPQSGEKK